MTEFDKRIVDQGGDPRCLHCRLSLLISDHLQSLSAPQPCGVRISAALAQMAGELIGSAPPEQQKTLLTRAIQIMGGSAGFPVTDETEPDDAAVETGAKLH